MEAFAKETAREWPKANFEQAPTHPAVNINWDDAKAFCAWLTERERKAGKLGAQEAYRLPSDMEWSAAVGLVPEAGASPAERSGKNAADFPWGRGFPPSQMNVGNYRDETWHGKNPGAQKWLKGYTDGFVSTSPVGSFPPNPFGLFDMGGNVWQWCEDCDANDSKAVRVVRGGSWDTSDRDFMFSSKRTRQAPEQRVATSGFRCVLEVAGR